MYAIPRNVLVDHRQPLKGYSTGYRRSRDPPCWRWWQSRQVMNHHVLQGGALPEGSIRQEIKTNLQEAPPLIPGNHPVFRNGSPGFRERPVGVTMHHVIRHAILAADLRTPGGSRLHSNALHRCPAASEVDGVGRNPPGVTGKGHRGMVLVCPAGNAQLIHHAIHAAPHNQPLPGIMTEVETLSGAVFPSADCKVLYSFRLLIHMVRYAPRRAVKLQLMVLPHPRHQGAPRFQGHGSGVQGTGTVGLDHNVVQDPPEPAVVHLKAHLLQGGLPVFQKGATPPQKLRSFNYLVRMKPEIHGKTVCLRPRRKERRRPRFQGEHMAAIEPQSSRSPQPRGRNHQITAASHGIPQGSITHHPIEGQQEIRIVISTVVTVVQHDFHPAAPPCHKPRIAELPYRCPLVVLPKAQHLRHNLGARRRRRDPPEDARSCTEENISGTDDLSAHSTVHYIGAMKDDLKETINQFPREPGVYQMKDAAGEVLYVGKAKNLRARVRSYLQSDLPVKTAVLMSRVDHIDCIVTGNEYEALLLENNLIKRYTPRYNINLKDGKTYPVIRITADEYPRVFRTRRVVHDGSTYFGPYPNIWRLESYLKLIESLYPLRKCRTREIRRRAEPCLYWHIHRCAAVCAGKTSHQEYLRRVEEIRALLSGKTAGIRGDLQRRMKEAAEHQLFEKAAEFRDALQSLEAIETEQRIEDFDPSVRDYLGYAARDGMWVFMVFQMRSGRMVGNSLFHGEMAGTDEENLEEFLVQFYSSTTLPPARLYLSTALADPEHISRFFERELKTPVSIHAAETTRDAAILRLCTENARQELEKLRRARGDLEALEELAAVLSLPAPPLVIEGFDIAQVGGRNTVAAMVCSVNGVPDPSRYRRYRIRSLPDGGIDDVAAMREVVARRYTRLRNEKHPLPDLILVDGGAGQVNGARAVLDALDVAVPVVGLAKQEEELYRPGDSTPLRLPEAHPALRVLQHLRDEAHRFATTYRAGLQKKDILTAAVRQVRGIGERRAARLMKAFPHVESILETPPDIVARSAGIPEELAIEVQQQVRKDLYGA